MLELNFSHLTPVLAGASDGGLEENIWGGAGVGVTFF